MILRAISLFIGFLFLSFLHHATAIRIPFARTTAITSSKRSITGFSKVKQLGVSNAASGDADGDVSLSTTRDLLYMANVTVGGESFTLQLDTGSSDLWVATQDTLPTSNSTSLTFNLTYGIGYAYGHITTAPVSFAGFTVESQAFLLATQANNPVSAYGAVGILGLGFTSLSSIDSAVNGTGGSWGRAFLFNAFASNTSSPNFISFALQRTVDPTDDVQGQFTIGEFVSGFESVQDMPAVSTWPVVDPNRWNVLLDGFYVSGVAQTLETNVKNVPIGKAVVLLDSGTSYSYVDPSIAQAMYGNIEGATLDSSSGAWTVPCNAEVDATFVIGGEPYPVHPLDAIDQNTPSTSTCVGTFVGQALSVGNGEFDWLIGDNVLRNMYTVYDFGDFQSNGQTGNPYIKILSLTNATAASVDFHNLRGGTANTTISASGVAVNGSTAASSSTVTADELEQNVNKLLDFMPALLGIMAFNSLVLLGLAGCAVMYFWRRGKARGSKAGGASGAGYHYTRVRSQYDPKEAPPPVPILVNGGGSSGSRGSLALNATPPSKNGSRASIHSAANVNPSGVTEDEPFTPPAEPDHESDLTTAGFQPPDEDIPPPPEASPQAYDPYSPASIAPIPRPRFISTTTMGTNDTYGRPQSLFSVASGQLLAPGGASPRPASSYDIPLGAPRPRFASTTTSDGRPDSTFSTSPLVSRNIGRGGSGNNSPSATDTTYEQDLMPPPRPRYMSDANLGPRPDSAVSMGSTGGTPLRPQSRFLDTSGARPYSVAQ